MEEMDDIDGQSGAAPTEATETDAYGATPPADERALLARINKEIKADKAHHAKAFARMRRDMRVATWGKDKDWAEGNYVANIVGRHVKQKTSALYAKNPKIVARRRETLDFKMWDESPQSLQTAVGIMQMAQQVQQAAAMAPPEIDGMSGMLVPAQPPEIPGLMEAQALLQDIQEGMQRRNQIKRIGKTLELLVMYYLSEQQPLDFKSAMKKVVRRASTTGVGYIELGFQRELGPRPDVQEALADARARLDHIGALAKQAAEGDIGEEDAETAELRMTIESLSKEPEVLLREGLVVDYPLSTKVIPDRLCKSLVGFVGSRHITVELMFTKGQVRDLFGVDLKKNGRTYQVNGDPENEEQYELKLNNSDGSGTDSDVVCVQKFYDKISGLCYLLCDGYDKFLRPPAPPDVFVESFWPVFAITFNDVENEDELFPPSDVALLLDSQKEYNRSRQGMREHRDAAKPRWGYAKGALDEESIVNLESASAFGSIPLNISPGTKLDDILQRIPVPGVDPNLYETGQLFSDMQLVVGAQQAQLGGLSKATATESAIAADSSNSADGSSIDDLDAFLSRVARAMGQILMREMSPEQVAEIVGPGAVWPEMTLETIVNEIHLEIEAGSSGKPNQAVEIRNWREMLPFLLQMPGLQPMWLLRETLRRLDDRMDLTEALAEGLPAIMAQNRQAQMAPADPMADPNAQGDKGGDNAPAGPGGPSGSGPAMGDNRDPMMGPGSTGAMPVM
jgi:hypothetical protein